MQTLSSHSINQLRRDARNIVRELGLLNDAYFDIGVTLAERHLLIELSTTSDPLTMSDIVDLLLIEKSTVSRLIAKAVKKNYVKCIVDKVDKRKRILKLTKTGTQVLSAFEPIAFNQTKAALLTLSNEEVETVYKGIALYAQGLRNSRLLNKEVVTIENCNKKIKKLAEIYAQLEKLGYYLEPFDQRYEVGLYNIFQEVVESGSQFPYENSSIQEFKQQFFSPTGHVYVCRSIEGDVIGGFYIRANFSGRANHIANAAYMIRDDHKGKGIGSSMIEASLHLAKNLGFQAMQFNMVLSKNIVAVNLYLKLGFNIIGTIPQAFRNPDGDYQDSYVMYRTLNDL